jgi:diadenosine tetraphosphate (Ap4A) HIT family hydrolase
VTSEQAADGFVLDPRLAADTVAVHELPLCSLRLMNDARWPWLILVPRRTGACELVDLDASQQSQLLQEINLCARALQRHCAPHKLNIAALGNVVAQLHIHIIARFRDDPAWPRPVWGHGEVEPYSDAALQARRSMLLVELSDA